MYFARGEFFRKKLKIGVDKTLYVWYSIKAVAASDVAAETKIEEIQKSSWQAIQNVLFLKSCWQYKTDCLKNKSFEKTLDKRNEVLYNSNVPPMRDVHLVN